MFTNLIQSFRVILINASIDYVWATSAVTWDLNCLERPCSPWQHTFLPGKTSWAASLGRIVGADAKSVVPLDL